MLNFFQTPCNFQKVLVDEIYIDFAQGLACDRSI